MIQLNCLSKLIDEDNKIYGYRLMDYNGNIRDIKPESLKRELIAKRVTVINLKLTKDGRIVDCDRLNNSTTDDSVTESQSNYAKIDRDIGDYIYDFSNNEQISVRFIVNEDLSTLKNKALLMGLKCTNLADDVVIMRVDNEIRIITDKNKFLISDGTEMFTSLKIKSIDFTNVDTSEMQCMEDMFSKSEIDCINLSSFNTSKVVNMSSAFRKLKTKELDLSSFDVGNVYYMVSMFEKCDIQRVKFPSGKASSMSDMSFIFREAVVEDLDLSGLSITKSTDMRGAFISCSIQRLKMPDTHGVIDMSTMFKYCIIRNLVITSFNTENVVDMTDMFYSASISDVIDQHKQGTNVTDDNIRIDLSKLNMSKVTKLSRMFQEFGSYELILPELNTKNIDKIERMFAESHISVLDMRKFVLDESTQIRNLFIDHDIEELKTIDKRILNAYETAPTYQQRYGQ